MPDIKNLELEYECPDCKLLNTKQIPFIPTPKAGSVKLESAWSCNNSYCDSKHRVKYNVIKVKNKDNKTFRFVPVSFTANSNDYTKTFNYKTNFNC